MNVDTLIVGGGLSGLALANLLEARGHAYHLVEARNRFGGRVLSHRADEQAGAPGFDLGPAWFWPHQPRMLRLTGDLGLRVFEQYSSGRLVLEEADGSVRRDLDFSTMAGSLRLAGGIAELTDRLAASLPAGRRSNRSRVVSIERMDGGLVSTIANKGEDIRKIVSRQVVLCLPTRLAADTIRFIPELGAAEMRAMADVLTWMGGQAKVVALYDTPFWRGIGLSGDGMSRRGPMVEIHDLSPPEGGPYALFGFVGVPAHIRQGREAELREAARQQLERMFGPEAGKPIDIQLKDWAFDGLTSTEADHVPAGEHPAYGMPHPLRNLWDGRLVFASSEMAVEHGGYLEGALEAAEAAADRIVSPVA
ncbi:FAD-dependent oxidoreductase [Stappia sp. F7233]|uniref:FAD-dependent oxidoreductase n=1 Tax=Stappia albiluteola TaxID=2758565 RepID=A0A839AGX5_9HYPH|nr:FAD-dependent oxidoreductase [Stappia albiluteola]MBA5778395.1 FAD-dependent oxidoreductase [Stappia albiluteola]